MSVKHADPTHQAGFTLIEGLVALSILAISLVAIFDAYSGGLRASTKSAEYLKARILAQSLLEEARSTLDAQPSARIGSFGQFRWRVSIAPAESSYTTTMEPGTWTLRHIEIHVSGPETALSVETLKLMRARR